MRIYNVSRSAKLSIHHFIREALEASGCSIVESPPVSEAPYQFSFETPDGERMGIIAYAFLANSKLTRNRPIDEHRFQVKYGAKDDTLHELHQDPSGVYTTLFFGVNPSRGIFVGADPVLNSPTRFFISKEFKEEHVVQIVKSGWFAWERVLRRDIGQPREILVGGTRANFLRYVRFEREAKGEDQGHRQLVAEQFGAAEDRLPIVSPRRLHLLETEFELSHVQILDLINAAPRLKTAVRGWVAEQHLLQQLRKLPDVTVCEAIEADGQPDVRLQFKTGRALLIECKNVLRKPSPDGRPRMDFMKSRDSKTDRCRRYYSSKDFDVVAACLHPASERWNFAVHETATMAPHKSCGGKLGHRVIVDESWSQDLANYLRAVAER